MVSYNQAAKKGGDLRAMEVCIPKVFGGGGTIRGKRVAEVWQPLRPRDTMSGKRVLQRHSSSFSMTKVHARGLFPCAAHIVA